VRNLLSARALYAESRLQQRWLEASVEIGAQLLAPSGEDPLHLIARRAIDIADADLVSVGLISPERSELLVQIAAGRGADELVGRSFRLSEFTAGRVAESGEPLLLSSTDGQTSHLASVIGAGPLMELPLRGTGATTRGILTVGRVGERGAFSATDLRMAAGFASHASVALELADSRAAEHKVLVLQERDRIAVDLHEHVIQELFAIGLNMVGIAARVRTDESLAARIRQCVDDTDRTIHRIRSSIFGLRSNASPRPADGLGPQPVAGLGPRPATSAPGAPLRDPAAEGPGSN
jgi:signal transduction histidine kinase